MRYTLFLLKFRNATLLLVFTLFLHATTCGANELSEKDKKKLLSNNIIVRAIEDSDGVPGVMAAFAVSSSRERIWGILLDYNNFKEIFENIINIEVISQDSKGALIEYWADAVFTELNYTLFRKYEKPYYKLSWSRISGDLEIIKGSWSILDSSEPVQKIVIYRSFVKVGGIVPTRVIRWGGMRKAEAMCKKLKERILKHNSVEKRPNKANPADPKKRRFASLIGTFWGG